MAQLPWEPQVPVATARPNEPTPTIVTNFVLAGSCPTCGAWVCVNDQDHHERWHLTVDPKDT